MQQNFLDLQLTLSNTKASRPSFQDLTIRWLEKTGQPYTYSMAKTECGHGYYLIRPDGKIIKGVHVPPVLAFVIQQNPTDRDALILTLGLCNHYYIAGKANSVKAAGDVYFSTKNGVADITKFTDQSGGYYVSLTDPEFVQKHASIKAAMQTVGLPMEKFEPCQPTMLFSTNIASQYTHFQTLDPDSEFARCDRISIS